MSVTVESQSWISAKQREFMPVGSLRARFAKGVVWSLTGAVISRGFTLLASIVCARLLGKNGFGELGMVQSTVGTFGLFAGLGLGLTATKYVAELREQKPEKVGRILALSTGAALFSSIIMTVLLVAMASLIARTTLAQPQLDEPLAIGAGLVFFGALNGAQTGALAGFEAFRTIARVNTWAGVLSFPLVVVGVWRWGLRGAIWGLVSSMAINWVLNNMALRAECIHFGIHYDFAHCLKEWRVLYEFTFPAFLASIVVGPALWICNMLLVRQPGGYAQLGLYTAADRWRLLILFVPTSIFAMAMPVLSNLYGSGNEAGFRRVFRTNLLLHTGLAGVPAIVVAALAIPIMRLYGTQFRVGWPILILLSFAALPEAASNIYMARLIVAERIWWRLGLDLQLVAMLLLLACLCIPRWGAMGLAMAYAGAMSALCFSQAVLARWHGWNGEERENV